MKNEMKSLFQNYVREYEKGFNGTSRCRDWWQMQKIDEAFEAIVEKAEFFAEATYEKMYEMARIGQMIGE
ncbi:MAG: hypothetical protein II238_01240 [Alphaproteobacteria bacterium]|nr:hypothetical protein [Alphaproteobacteria bacterium]